MTYLNSRPDNIAAQNPDETLHEDFAEYTGLFQMLITMAMMLLAKFARARGPKTRNALMFTLAVLVTLHGGTREEKRALVKRLFAQSEKRLNELDAKYRIWRQRKCWMWGGGFRAGVLVTVPDVFKGARDLASFEALIPD